MNALTERIKRFEKAVELLPYHLRGAARFLDENQKAEAEEFRLRIGFLPTVLLPEGEQPFGHQPVTLKELGAVLEVASAASAHAVKDSLKNGYITARGGFRVGLGGQAALREGEVVGFLHLGSAAIRITKEIQGLADPLLPQIMEGNQLKSTLIISPPGGGKTTVLRDIIRQCSAGGRRVAVADERGEISAMREGVPQMNLGPRTDVLTGCFKDQAVMMLLRAMNPEIVAMDEITASADTQALENAANCGVALLATAHGAGVEDLMGKPMYRRMIRRGLFQRFVVISRGETGRRYEVIGERPC